MKRLNELLQELGVSKVKLAKYLGVSRQMVYNYLVLDSLDKWPKEKKLLLLQLLDIEDGEEETINKIQVNTDYLMSVEKRLNNTMKAASETECSFSTDSLTKDNRSLLNNIIFLLKEKLEEDADGTNADTIRYLYYFLQSLDNIPEILNLMKMYMMRINNLLLKVFYIQLYLYTTVAMPAKIK